MTQKEFDTIFKKPIYKKNLDDLISDGIVTRSQTNKDLLRLFQREHQLEVKKILNFEVLENRALKMQPSTDRTKNLQSIFYEYADQNRSEGVYYFYREKKNPDSWTVFARANPHREPYRYPFGSIKDSGSKLRQMWTATVQAWKSNAKQSIRRGQAEKIDQDAFGNNRQAGFAAFKLFTYAGWLRVSHVGRTVYYNVVDEKAHLSKTKLNQFANNVLKARGFDY